MYIPKFNPPPLKKKDRRIYQSDSFLAFFNSLDCKEKVVFINNTPFLEYAYYFPQGIDDNPLVFIATNADSSVIHTFCHICQRGEACHHIVKLASEIAKKYEDLGTDSDWQQKRHLFIEEKTREEQDRLIAAKNEAIRQESLNKISSFLTEINNQDINLLLRLVKVVPAFRVDKDYRGQKRFQLTLKVGVDKFYSIGNIAAFLEDIVSVNEKSYGKFLSFKHQINNFDEPSRALIEILMKYHNRITYPTKYITLDAGLFESILKIYKNHTLEISNLINNQTNDNYYLRLDNIDSTIHLNKKYTFEIIYDSEEKQFKANKHTFFIKDNVIDISKSPEKRLLPLYNFIEENPNFSYKHIKDVLMKEVLSRFYKNIIIADGIKEEVSIKDFTIKTYLDYQDDIITVKTDYLQNEQIVSEEEISSYRNHDLTLNNYKLILQSFGFENDIIQEPEQIFSFLLTDLSRLQEVATVYLSEKLKKMQAQKYQPIKMNASYNTGMLSICFVDSPYSDDELAKIIRGIRKKVKYIKLKNNVILEVNEENANKLLNTIDEFNLNINNLSLDQNIPIYQALKLHNNNLDIIENIPTEQIKGLLKDIGNYKEAQFKIPPSLEDNLRSYQKEAFLWMKTLVKHNLNGVLADDMGLGKSIEMISVIISDESCGPSLIVCPKSLCYNWRNEFDLWAPHKKIVNIIGSGLERENIIKSIRGDEDIVYITSYDSLRIDLPFYEDLNFLYMVLDEGQHIKNHDTLKAQSVKSIKATHRFVLTGTPIENSVMDLWSIFDFLMPNYLGAISNFKTKYEKAIIERKDPELIKNLIMKISPFILRRAKNDVIKDLPNKVELIQVAKMTNEQEKIYQAELKKTRDIIRNSDNKIEILACITRLRQVCVDPSMYIENYHGGSGKINLVLELIEEYLANNHRIILFSQFTSIFEKIATELKTRNIKYYLLTGKTKAEDRVKMATDFNNSDEYQVFLVSLKAGGTGLNLIGADFVIHLDPWWNIAVENQASDRAHRIGQTRVVHVIKLICEDSIEQKVIELQEHKKEIVKMIVADDDTNIQKLSQEDLEYLISD